MGKAPWSNDRLARWDMRIENILLFVSICCSIRFFLVPFAFFVYITYVRPLVRLYGSLVLVSKSNLLFGKIEEIQRYFIRRVLKHIGLPYRGTHALMIFSLCFPHHLGPETSCSKKLMGAQCNTNWKLNFFSNNVVNGYLELIIIQHSWRQIYCSFCCKIVVILPVPVL